MNKHQVRKILFSVVLILSFMGNIVCLAPYIVGYLQRDHTACFTLSASDTEVTKAVVAASMGMDQMQMSTCEYHGLIPDIKSMFTSKRHSDIFNNYYTAYNYVGLSYYAKQTHDTTVIDYLLRKCDSWLSSQGNLTYELSVVDQSPIGIVYQNLYDITQDIKYKNVADDIYEYLKSRRHTGNLIPYNNSVNNLSDAIGMYVPFLMEYYHHTGDTLARRIAIDNINHFKAHGIDRDTHIPFHGYNIETSIKLGSCNWGRGIGWYLLALAFCTEENDSILQSNINKLPYTQFPLSSGNFDSSTALMFEIYKQATIPDRELNIDFIKNHIRENGMVADCSGDTYNLNDYSHIFSNSELCNGFFLILISKFVK